MGKKRKSNSSVPIKEPPQRAEQIKYNVNEQFADSEDEFFAGRDQILLADSPASKGRNLHKDGKLSPSFNCTDMKRLIISRRILATLR